MSSKHMTTKEGYDKFVHELQYLKSTERQKIADEIKAAKEFGDLSENSEYSAALEKRDLMEKRIEELEEYLKNVEIVEDTNEDDVINIGRKVELMREDTKEKKKIKLVGTNEASPFNMEISIESPIGKAIFKKKINDKVEVNINGKSIVYIIKKIE